MVDRSRLEERNQIADAAIGHSTRREGYRGFRDLRVYQLAYQLSIGIFNATKSFPPAERFSLVDQIRRSSRSIAAHIAEAWQQRKYRDWFVSKLSSALGEASETGVWLDMAKDFGYLDSERHEDLMAKCDEIERMLFSMINDSSKFCH